MQPPNEVLPIYKLPFLNGSYRNGVFRVLWALFPNRNRTQKILITHEEEAVINQGSWLSKICIFVLLLTVSDDFPCFQKVTFDP